MSDISEELYDKIADEELHHLEKVLLDFDPDELDLELSQGVLTITLPSVPGGVLKVNSHRAARQIWMAAFRQAWHFSPVEENGSWSWRTAAEELRTTLSRILGEKLGREVTL